MLEHASAVRSSDRCMVFGCGGPYPILSDCCSSVEGHSSFQFGAIMNNAPVDIHVSVLMWTCVYFF